MRQYNLGYFSSYDRGLVHLLKMWPKIKEKYPDATLHICYGWDLFVKVFSTNPERMAWKDKMDKLIAQEGIIHHGKVGKDELKAIRQKCGIWAYPTDFDEIFCITALECQNDGCVPCVINKAALQETVQSGEKVEGDIWDPDISSSYLNRLLNLMGDEKRWKVQQEKGREYAKNWAWEEVARQWPLG